MPKSSSTLTDSRSIGPSGRHPTRISRVRVQRLDIAMKKAFGIAGGAQELARNVLVEVTLDGGTRGWGEAAPLPFFNGETQDQAFREIEEFAPSLIGRDVRHWREHAERIHDEVACASAACALETAILDAFARHHAMPLHAYFGGKEGAVTTDITITTGTVDEARTEARLFAEFDTLKIKVGGPSGGDVDKDIARVLAVAEARPDARILLDANGGLSVENAISLAKGLTSRGVVPALFEQPVVPGSWEALAEVRAQCNIPVAIDESVTKPSDVVEAHARGAADAANVKLMKSGIARALDIVAATRACGMQSMIGGMVESRLTMGVSACIAAGLGGFSFVDLDTPLFLAEEPFEGGYEQRGASLDVRAIDAGHGCRPKS